MSVTLTVDDLKVVLDGSEILHGVHFTVRPGEFVTLLGPSGSGKTTTLNVVAGFVRPTSGHVLIDERPCDAVPSHERDIGIVFQNYALFPHMSVVENVEFPLRARRIGRAERRRMAREALELVALGGMEDRRIRSLSGGQQQRVALARALVFRPRLLLLDEPLAALDKALRESMQVELKRIQHEVGVTTIAVTHDQAEALTMSDRVAIMRDGRLEQIDTPEAVYRHPATLFAAQFLGEANLLAVEPDGTVPAIGLRLGARSGTAVIRPEQLGIGPAGEAGADATVEQVSFQGVRYRVLCRGSDRNAPPLVVSLAADRAETVLSPGDPVSVFSECPEAVHIIDSESGPAPVPALAQREEKDDA